MASIDNIYMCPHCVVNGDLTEITDTYEESGIVGYNCPKCGIQAAYGSKAELEFAALTQAAAESLGWNIRLLAKIFIESIKRGFTKRLGM